MPSRTTYLKFVLFFLTGFSFVLVSETFAQNNTVELDLSDQIVKPQHYIVTKTDQTLEMDGRADETAWTQADFTDLFVDIEGVKKPKFDTRLKMLWDDEFLYVFAEMEEPHVWGDITERDQVMYYNNDFEIFIDPSGDTRNYGEIEINALNTVWDLLLSKPYRTGGKYNTQWDIPGIKSGVYIDGTLNNESDKDKGWSVEVAVPLKAFVLLKNKPKTFPKEGEQWRINFSRVEWDYEIVDGRYRKKKDDSGALLPEYNWVWSNQTMINMHAPEKWGYLQFTGSKSANGIDFIEDEDWEIKQVAYAAFLTARQKLAPKWAVAAPYSEKTLQITYGSGKELKADFFKTKFGFEITITSPITEKIYLINEDGVLKELATPQKEKPFVFATWAHGGNEYNDSLWTARLEEYKRLGISEVLVGGSPDFLTQLVQKANGYDIKIHAWMWTLNRPNDTIASKHPEWYAVNRAGKNSLEYRAYVDYYQWLSPFHPEAREYIKSNVRKLTQVEGLASIHLDYVRYVDVILGADLQPKYNLVQDHEMPEYDYGYHPIAREGFKAIFGYDPLDLEHPELSTEWRQYRLNAITSLVNELVEIAHSEGHDMTAAVFPFPEMSRQMVRQAWNDWNLDTAFPMLYNNFYRENVNWIGFATEQGVNDVDFPIYAGLYAPALKNPADMEKAIRLARENGAAGISIFTAEGLSDEQKAVFVKLRGEL